MSKLEKLIAEYQSKLEIAQKKLEEFKSEKRALRKNVASTFISFAQANAAIQGQNAVCDIYVQVLADLDGLVVSEHSVKFSAKREKIAAWMQ